MIHEIKVNNETFVAIQEGHLKFVIMRDPSIYVAPDDHVALNEVVGSGETATYTGRGMLMQVTGSEMCYANSILSLDPCEVNEGNWNKFAQVQGSARIGTVE